MQMIYFCFRFVPKGGMNIATDWSVRMAFKELNQISIFIADDHTLYVDALTIALQQQPGIPIKIIGTASNGEELLVRLRKQLPDILLLDLNLSLIHI